MDRKIGAQLSRLLLVAAMLTTALLALWWSLPFLYPFLLGWLLAYALNPLVGLLHVRARLPRWLAVGVTLLLFTSALLAIASALVMRLVDEIVALSRSLQNLVAWAEKSFNDLLANPEIQDVMSRINDFYLHNPGYKDTINNSLSNTAQAITNTGTGLISLFFSGIVRILYSLPAVMTIAIVVLLASFFIGKDWNRYGTRIQLWFPRALVRKTGAVWRDLRFALFGYVRAQLIMISITAVVIIIGLWLIGVKNALAIGLIIGFVDLLPYLGVGAAMIPWIAYEFLTGNWTLGTGLSVLYGIILVARQIIEPKVLASSVGLDPLPTLIAMFAGLKLFGIFGLIIGPIAVVILTACHRANVFRDIGRYVKYGGR
ncbi:sporulation integral membrane protein YtvI [Cohnella sp. CIP 111063]|uniref:sporulation integral membrane protein YtvI n=1 Tax=unclassified Cohnella TaxID=2636738 RepID=UPI000B8C30C5|nr:MULTISPECIES: sporulation integral membrane protein YtvI [unclassified Cohnella]OXS62794.1 sporulation integral membrane protein YtvI [Cohnella sp. CIP 111063]PRX75076.1 sporulation integral membrane protein YtvI [Cohnella sp. SGD-V74]